MFVCLVVCFVSSGKGEGSSRHALYISSSSIYPTLDCPANELFFLYLCKEVRAPFRMHCVRTGSLRSAIGMFNEIAQSKV